jgi:hypothetical protein
MSETDGMNIDERRKYLHKMWGKYRNATKAEKGALVRVKACVNLNNS